jgi:uncharacterized membrane protein
LFFLNNNKPKELIPMDAFYQALNDFGYTHPVHPTMVYLPIGGVMAAFIFGIIAVLFRGSSFAISARHSILLAFFASFPTIFLGYMDWQHFYGGNWMFPIKMKIALATLLVVLLFITILNHYRYKSGMKIILPLYALCFLNVVGIGYFGGEIVFGGSGAKQSTSAVQADTTDPESQKSITFNEVSEIFEQHCNMCHAGSSAPHGLQLVSYEQVMAGGEHGEVIVPGIPNESELILRIEGKSEPAMPFRQPPLSENTIKTLVRWVEEGAPKGNDASR